MCFIYLKKSSKPPLPYPVMSRPSLTFAAFIEERDRCRDPLYVTTDDILRKGFFCNTNRTWDRVSKQLELVLQGVRPRASRPLLA